MLDAKFVCTISALVAALVAVCSFNSNQKMEIIEGYGNTPNGNTGFGAWQGGSQFSVYKSPAAVTTQVNGNPIVTNEQLKNGMFYSTVGLQQSLAPRASATSIYGALKNQSQAQTQQAANGPNGALPQNQGSTMSPNSNVSAAFLNTGTDNTITALNTEGAALVQSSNQFDQQQSMDLTQGVGVSSDGTVTYSMAKSYDQHQPNIEKFIVPGDKTKPCAGGCNRGPEFMADPVMDANYTNGNFNTMNESLLRPVAVQDIPIGTMRTINAGGDESNVESESEADDPADDGDEDGRRARGPRGRDARGAAREQTGADEARREEAQREGHRLGIHAQLELRYHIRR